MFDLKEIFSTLNFNCAWENLKAKNKAGGVDDISIVSFKENISNSIAVLQDEVLGGTYVPEPYKKIFIEKNIGGLRPLALLTVKDKLVQQCLFNYFILIMDKIFVNTSYAYRPNKSHTKAICRIQDFINRGGKWVLPLDINDFFDTIDREILIDKCRCFFGNNEIIKLITMWISIGTIHKGRYTDSNTGIPQGGVISPMLSNLYLNDYDKFMLTNKFDNVRYADNIILISKSKEQLALSLKQTKAFLSEKLKLNLNNYEKEAISITEPFSFCGIQFTNNKKVIDPNKYDHLIIDFKKLLERNFLFDQIEKINEHFDGLRRYYIHFDTAEQLEALNNKYIELIIGKISNQKEKKPNYSKQNIAASLRKINFLFTGSGTQKEILIKKIINGVFKFEKALEPNRAIAKKIDLKRRQYQKFWYGSLDINISSFSTQIGKSGNNIVIRREGKIKNEISSDKVQNILISAKGITISSDAVRLCTEKNIRINYFDELGKPYASVIPASSPVSSAVQLQNEAVGSNKSKIIIKALITAKIKNQLSMLKYFLKNKNIEAKQKEYIILEMERINKYLASLSELSINMELDDLRGKILGYEGLSASSYWAVVKILIPEEYGFQKREHRDAEDIVNMMLNYSYGILYTRVLNSVITNGLNPNLGFLHSGQKNKPALVFDLIEQFRPVAADRAVIALLTKNIKAVKNKNLLSDDTRNKLAKKVLTRLNTEFYYKNKLTSLNEIIYQKTKELKNYISSESKSYKPYLYKW